MPETPERDDNVEAEEPRVLSDNETEAVSGGIASDDPNNPFDGPKDPIPPSPPSQG